MANSKIFAEYIMARYQDFNFSGVPINPIVNFYFMCAFAIDYALDRNTYTDGNFNVYWGDNISSDAVTAIKMKHPNVKVAVSIGGATLNALDVYFNVLSNVDTWVENAYTSLKKIIQKYNLDGIDIDYENFSTSTPTFTECIGQLIKRLKIDKVVKFVSIAPYNDVPVQEKYQALWAGYRDVIDYVNFQFYAYPEIQNVQQYVEYYGTQVTNYPGPIC